jgi:hypothetical protein
VIPVVYTLMDRGVRSLESAAPIAMEPAQ